MYLQPNLKLTPVAALLATALGIFPVTGYCVAAGRVDFAIGDVAAVTVDGVRRSLEKGSEINIGEAIDTATGARAQIRFSDGGYVSLQPNSQFRVDDYHFENKANGEEKGFFSLLKGGLRAITGAIGHFHRDSYRVSTPVATIGIRGTGYNAVLGDGLSVSVANGAISLTNKGGSLILSQGQSAFVADFNSAPSLTFEQPATPPASLGGTAPPPKEEHYVQGNDTGSTSGGLSTGVTVLTGVASVVAGPPFGNQALAEDYPGIVVFNSSGSNVYYIQASPPAGSVTDFSAGTKAGGIAGTDSVGYMPTGAAIPASGYDGIIGWSRFYGPVSYTEPGLPTATAVFSANQGVHTVLGIPTAVMPTIGSAHYALTGATAPTLVSGAVTPGSVTGGGLDVYFSATPSLTGNLSLAIGGYSYSLNFSGSFSGNGLNSGGSITNSAGSANGGCPGSCIANTSGFFAGTNAERAGIAYSINGSVLNSTIGGAAVYTKTGLPAVAY